MVKKIVKNVENIGLITMTILAAAILIAVLVTFGVSETPGLFQLATGTLATAWITLFAMANIKEDRNENDKSK